MIGECPAAIGGKGRAWAVFVRKGEVFERHEAVDGRAGIGGEQGVEGAVRAFLIRSDEDGLRDAAVAAQFG